MNEHIGNGRRQLESALVTGGTGFVYRHTVAEFLVHGYEVTTMTPLKSSNGDS